MNVMSVKHAACMEELCFTHKPYILFNMMFF